jgi:hypothetical protein
MMVRVALIGLAMLPLIGACSTLEEPDAGSATVVPVARQAEAPSSIPDENGSIDQDALMQSYHRYLDSISNQPFPSERPEALKSRRSAAENDGLRGIGPAPDDRQIPPCNCTEPSRERIRGPEPGSPQRDVDLLGKPAASRNLPEIRKLPGWEYDWNRDRSTDGSAARNNRWISR